MSRLAMFGAALSLAAAGVIANAGAAAAANDGYGIARFVSERGSVEHNDVSGAEEAGIYVGDSPHADVLVAHNHSHGNGSFGFFFRDSSHGEAFDNLSNDNCDGIIVIR